MKTFIVAAVASAALIGAGSASADGVGIAAFGGSATINGESTRQAGAHPDLTTDLRVTQTTGVNGEAIPSGDLKTVVVDLPPGLSGNPTAVPTCSTAELIKFVNGGQAGCPIGSQVGVVRIITGGQPQMTALYNMERPPNLPALFAFNYTGAVVTLEPHVRPDDYAISVTVPNISQALEVGGATVTFWGVPADPIHNAERFDPNKVGPGRGGFGASSPEPLRAFMTAPTACEGTRLTTRAAADSWQAPGIFAKASFDADFDGTPFVAEGCERLPFEPSITVRPGSQLADAPTGLSVDLSVPQTESPYGLATAHVRKVKVTLPDGMSVSPSSAAGLGACAPSQIKLGSDEAPSCPDSSKIGSIRITTPLLDDPLEGDVILATQNDNPFRSLLALYLVARGSGVMLKLPGRVDPDPVTGRLTTTFENTPQLPFSEMHLEFRGGARAPLATPVDCGRYETRAEITSWASSVPVVRTTPMVIDEGCGARPFETSLSAGSTYPLAGADSPFTFAVTRADRTQYLSRIDAILPPGLLARIASVPQCPEAQAAAGTCARGTEIGSTSVLSGPGESPLPLSGRVYLTGPYKDAPFGLSIVVPTAGQAGPFDLGDVVVRAAIYVDRTDAHVTVKSDPLPRIISGFPLRLRQVIVAMDRPGFMFNPTSCSPSAVTGVFESTQGASLVQPVSFQVAGCGDLPVNHKLSLKFTGKKSTTDGTHPGVSATLTSKGKTANLKKATVKLPLSVALDPKNAEALCKPAQRLALNCPKASIVGRATAESILPHPLTGPVYFVEGTRRSKSGRVIATLPKLWIPLSGDGVTIDVNADSAVDDINRLETTFNNIPDAPISSFKLTIYGGKHGILAVSGKPGTCERDKTLDSEFVGQNGLVVRQVGKVTVEGCKPKVTKTKATSKAVTLQVGNLGAGKLTVRGTGVKPATRTLKAASTASITAKLTRKAQAAVRRRKSMRLSLAITFTPKAGKAVKMTKNVTVRR